ISITTDATQIGTEETELMAKVEGEEIKIALNSDYLLDLLNSLPNGEISLAVHSKLSPVLLKHQNYPDYLHIIMPLKI
nr:hypothetical protein [Candidatus Gracilibacteria bacterium]